MKINKRWEALKEDANANIQSEKGILKRQIRSIQMEGQTLRKTKASDVFITDLQKKYRKNFCSMQWGVISISIIVSFIRN